MAVKLLSHFHSLIFSFIDSSIIAKFIINMKSFLSCFIGLKFLVRLCTDQGLDKDVQEFAVKLKKAEKSKELREQV